MSAQHPVVFVTRRLPEAVEARLTADYTPVLNVDDTPYPPADLVERVVNALSSS